MKQIKLTFLLTVLMSMVGAKAFAYDIAVKNADGVEIYYNYINDGLELEVAGFPSIHKGNAVIPDEVTYMNRTRKVTSIGDYAFYQRSGLTSVTIPNSVTSIGNGAFASCSGLTSVTIPNSVTSIDARAFSGCDGLKKVIVKDIAAWCSIDFGDGDSNPLKYAHHIYSDANTEITDLVIPNSVTSIGGYAFYKCSGMTSVTIPNSVTSIGSSAFENCSGLTSVTIPNSVTSIGYSAFLSCSGLTSVTIPNSVTSIGEVAFSGCSGLTSVTIPNSVTSIGGSAFNCDNLATVVSLIEKPFNINGKSLGWGVFSNNTFMNGTLYVPNGTKEAYKATYGWKDFVFIEEGNGGGGGSTPVIPETKKCEKPTVSYRNGKLTFSSATEGATCVSSITDADMGTYTTNEVQLGVTYNISVYAAKAGYENSETVTATLCWIDQEPKTEGITSGVASVKANAVLMQSEAGVLSIQGVDDGTPVSVYTVNGTEAGSAVSNGGQAQVNTNLQPGTVAIVKIGEKSVKVVMK